jgi:putative Holliday junction resolvase
MSSGRFPYTYSTDIGSLGGKGDSVGRTLGLDVGDKRIGVAISDPLGWTAQPLTVIHRVGIVKDVAALREATKGIEVERVVAGLPLELNGNEGTQAARVRRFCQALAEATGVEVVYQDERLTTVQSRRLLESAGVRREQRKGVLDKMAAALILQSWLDGQAHRS